MNWQWITCVFVNVTVSLIKLIQVNKNNWQSCIIYRFKFKNFQNSSTVLAITRVSIICSLKTCDLNKCGEDGKITLVVSLHVNLVVWWTVGKISMCNCIDISNDWL